MVQDPSGTDAGNQSDHCDASCSWPREAMDEIMALTSHALLKVIEDARMSMAKRIGDARSWLDRRHWHISSCEDKIITTAGEGGLITLNPESLTLVPGQSL